MHPVQAAPASRAEPLASRGELRFLTCGSVDDGKSTLIGRLINDATGLFEDQIKSLRDDSRRFGTTDDDIDFALLLDGLEAEREQGITIDVAYRFFSTPKRAFVVADTPGHQQYTRNMATGASNAELAILLVDARKGMLEQTRRHAAIVSLLGIRHVVLAVNKIDLVDFDMARFREIEADFAAFAAPLAFTSIVSIPLSARFGDNVAMRSDRMAWYDGPSLLHHLETVETDYAGVDAALRFPVQWVNRPDAEFRGFAGTIASGRVAVGDTVVVANSGQATQVTRIVTFDGDLPAAGAGRSVTLTLADEIDIARGDVLGHPKDRPTVTRRLGADLIWMDETPAAIGQHFLLKIGTATVPATLSHIADNLVVETLDRLPAGVLPVGAGALPAVPAPLPGSTRTGSPGWAAAVLRRARRAHRRTVLCHLARATTTVRMGGLCQAPVRRTGSGAGLSVALHPSGGDLQHPTGYDGRQRRHLPLEGLSRHGQNALQDDDHRCR